MREGKPHQLEREARGKPKGRAGMTTDTASKYRVRTIIPTYHVCHVTSRHCCVHSNTNQRKKERKKKGDRIPSLTTTHIHTIPLPIPYSSQMPHNRRPLPPPPLPPIPINNLQPAQHLIPNPIQTSQPNSHKPPLPTTPPNPRAKRPAPADLAKNMRNLLRPKPVLCQMALRAGSEAEIRRRNQDFPSARLGADAAVAFARFGPRGWVRVGEVEGRGVGYAAAMAASLVRGW